MITRYYYVGQFEWHEIGVEDVAATLKVECNFSKSKRLENVAIVARVLTFLVQFLNSAKDEFKETTKFVGAFRIDVYIVRYYDSAILSIN